jgi:hypothetical protein
MSRAECFRALGVDPEASWEALRQAYKDLVRVWHPDRFQSDPQFQRKAEQQLRRINEAYFALKNSDIHEGRQPEPAPQQKPANRFAWNLLLRWPIKAAWLGLICLAPLAIGGLLVNRVRVPTLESLPSGDGQSTTAELSSWARGEVTDLWRSIPKIWENDGGPREQPPRDTGAVAPGTPENGTELLRTRMSGGSQLWVSNPASQDAVATLVEAGTASPVRVIYIEAKNKVCIRHIAPGVYHLLAETGENWDANRVRFQTGRRALERNGPFQCIDMTSAHVTSGQCLDVSSKEDTARPKYGIVLGTY